MQPGLAFLHCHTPKLTVIEPRGLAVRSLDYHRAVEGLDAEARVNRMVYDPVGRVIELWDPRLFLNASALANLITIHSLRGTALCTVSVDSGLHVGLFGEAGQAVHSWDGRGSQRWMHYDKLLRLSELFEQAAQGVAIRAECLSYATNEPAFADHNQCGRLICHEDVPGALRFNDYALTGAALAQERLFADQPSPGFITRSHFNPLGNLLSRTDAQGNEQRFRQTLDGQLCALDLRLNDTADWLPMVSAIRYNSHGQVQQEIAGNGVTTTLEYAEEDGRLKRRVSRLGQNDPLQDLRYVYDPVGNVSSIEDAALPIRYFANQRIEPVSHYRYDTRYRLIEATGWEAGAVKRGPSSALTLDPAMPGNYRQTYRYDAGNNLLELTHIGPQNHGHRLVAAAHSNRCLPVRDGVEPTEQDLRDSFDANGNLLKLQPGQTLSWDLRNQLREVRPVARDSGDDDHERYAYGADGMRVRKVRSLQTNAQTNILETFYLPGLEIRTHSGTGEVLHVIDVATGRGSVRVLHWVAGKPEGIANNQRRFSLTDHLGSSTLELDQNANVITQEKYYSFGDTAWSNGEAVQVSYKTVRYSGKERDATGFYYYGFRYYATWLQRWLNPDPAGGDDGLNLYCMVRNNPISLKDDDGQKSTFSELFKPEQGDLIFGMYKVVESRYLGVYARLSYRGDVLAMYFTTRDIAALVGNLGKMRLSYYKSKYYMDVTSPENERGLVTTLSNASVDQRKTIMLNVKKGYDYWRNEYAQVTRKVHAAEDVFYGRIRSSRSSIMYREEYRDFAGRFALELSGGKYSVYETFKDHIGSDDGVFLSKFVSRASKAGLSAVLKSESAAVIHFVLDDLDMKKVVMKTQASITSSELRFLYRHRRELVDKVLFYQGGRLVDAPWRTDRALWNQYKPRSTF